jgi:DNA-binding transcriptional LysR family regulator
MAVESADSRFGCRKRQGAVDLSSEKPPADRRPLPYDKQSWRRTFDMHRESERIRRALPEQVLANSESPAVAAVPAIEHPRTSRIFLLTTQNSQNQLNTCSPNVSANIGFCVMVNAHSQQFLLGPRRPKLELQQLRHAVLAADLGSFRQAAEAFLTTQSSISRSIRQLEHQVGIVIFERYSGGIRPTIAGRSFIRISRSILEQMDALVGTARANRNANAGRLVVGFCTSLTAGNLRASLLEFRQRYPQIELATVESSRARLASGLRNSILDILVVAGDVPTIDCNVMPLWSERILVVLPQDHPLAPSHVIYWTDLRGQSVLLSQYDPGRELEELLNTKLAKLSDRPRIERHDVSRGVIKSLISMGLGISLVLESDIGANFAGLTFREMSDGSGPSRIGFSALWRPNNENQALQAFLKLLSERHPLPS